MCLPYVQLDQICYPPKLSSHCLASYLSLLSSYSAPLTPPFAPSFEPSLPHCLFPVLVAFFWLFELNLLKLIDFY